LDTAREAMALLVAVPPDKVTGPPKALPSIWNCTVPVRVPAPGATGFTVAVKDTDWPDTDGFTDEATVVVLLAWLTVCVSGEPVLSLPMKLLLPPYTAVIVCDATDNAAVVNVAWPALSALLPSVFVPSEKVTVPVGVPAPGNTALTVAVKVTDWPNTEGLTEEATVVVLLA